MTQETVKITVELILTSDGEIPTNIELEDMIASELGGELDENGLSCMAVMVVDRTAERRCGHDRATE